MGDFNSTHNRAVWFDIPVIDLDRARAFYAAVLDIEVHKHTPDQFSFCVLEHQDGNGGCLIPRAEEVSADGGILLYLNVDGRIQDAVAQTEAQGGAILEPVHSIGPHGFRALVLDSEGNRLALHSNTDG
jgi:uncharacterized protein